MTDAERLAVIEKTFRLDHCVQNFDAAWLISRVRQLQDAGSHRAGESQLQSG